MTEGHFVIEVGEDDAEDEVEVEVDVDVDVPEEVEEVLVWKDEVPVEVDDEGLGGTGRAGPRFESVPILPDLRMIHTTQTQNQNSY